MSQIKLAFGDISGCLHISDIPDELDNQLKLINRNYTSQYLIERFLQGKGIPSGLHFEDAKQHFTDYVDLSHTHGVIFEDEVEVRKGVDVLIGPSEFIHVVQH